jgi:hypothetical protein
MPIVTVRSRQRHRRFLANQVGLASTLVQREVRFWSNFGSVWPECSALSDPNDPYVWSGRA